ncbi:MAG: MBL fold metallo-hydrolase, partial [Christensenellales bacterium]
MQMFVVGCSNSWTTRPTSCYLLDGHIMFDCGGGTSKNVIVQFGVDKLDEVDYIFITHFHADHIFAINEYLSEKIIFNYDSNNRLTVVGLKGLKECLECLFKFSTKKPIKMEDYINIIEIDDFSKSLQVGKYTIKPYLLNHGDY